MTRNIHILPTNRPSILHKAFNKLFITSIVPTIQSEIYESIPQYIFITDNYSDIKENDYIITKDGRLVQVSYLLSKDVQGATKVVITSDPELIKDGIKEVSEGFVEWLVENPDCEYVQVEIDYKKFKKGNITLSQCYEIEIPNEDKDFLGRTYFDQLKQKAIEEEMEEYYKEVEVTTYNEEEVKLILGKLMGDIFRGKGVHLNEWFEENKKK